MLAAYTYQSGLRAPALIAFVKDSLIYLVIIVAVIYMPAKLGGWGDDLRRGRRRSSPRRPAPGDGILLNANNQLQYVTLALRLGAGAVPLPALASPACWPRATAT